MIGFFRESLAFTIAFRGNSELQSGMNVPDNVELGLLGCLCVCFIYAFPH
jgi:hypothetical protein